MYSMHPNLNLRLREAREGTQADTWSIECQDPANIDRRETIGGMSPSADLSHSVPQLLRDRFRLEAVADFKVSQDLSSDSGYFQFGPEAICYGQCSSGAPAKSIADPRHDASQHVATNGPYVRLPFDPLQIVKNLWCERYSTSSARAPRTVAGRFMVRDLYYLLRPLMPVAVRRPFQKLYFRGWENIPFPSWPVDRTVENVLERLLVVSMKHQQVRKLPFIWYWPEGAPSCTIVTHDVETSAGVAFCPQLMDLNDTFQIKSSFQIVPEKRYPVPPAFLENIRTRGFEVNVQDLNHDGLLFSDREEFLRRAKQINAYAKEFDAQGFRSAVLYRNTDWYDALDFSYDMSIPNVAHLDPQRGGCCTVLPFLVGQILELPVTTTQDYTLFQMLNDYSTRLWERQIALIRQKHGLISFIIHPDYIIDKAARRVYTELLQRLANLRAEGQTWIALPRDVAAWWRIRSGLTLIKEGLTWRIEGHGSERARVAYAVLDNDTLTYEF